MINVGLGYIPLEPGTYRISHLTVRWTVLGIPRTSRLPVDGTLNAAPQG